MNWGRFNILDVSNEEHIKLFKDLENKIGDDSPRFIDELKILNPLEVKTTCLNAAPVPLSNEYGNGPNSSDSLVNSLSTLSVDLLLN